MNVGKNSPPDTHRIVIYGTGGIGKSTLAAYLPGPFFLDTEEGSRFLEGTSYDIDLRRAPTWELLRGKLASIAQTPPPGIKSIIVDTVSAAEEMAKEQVISTRPLEKSGDQAESIESYGWGKGWQFVYDEFNGLLADLDRCVAVGLNVCLIAHEVSSPIPAPEGEFLRWEPNLYDGDKKGRGSTRNRIKGWADHVLYIQYNRVIADGRGQGGGSRSIYTQELATCLAKSRSVQGSWPFSPTDPGAVWAELGINP